jgi:hypothetical protein
MWLATSNDRKLIRRVFHSAGMTPEELTFDEAGHFGAAIFASGGEVLSVRRPLAGATRLDETIDDKLRCHRMVGSWRPAQGRPFRSERTQPFRHKGWIMALCGESPPAEQPRSDDQIEKFVSHYVRGDTARELLMGRILARLHAADPRSPKPEPQLLKDAILGAIEPIVGPGFESFSIALTTDDYGVVFNHGRNVVYSRVRRLLQTPDELAYQFTDPGSLPGSHLRATVVLDGPTPAGGKWTALESGSLLVVDELPPATVL